MAIGTGTVRLSEVKTEFGGTFAPNNIRSYFKCGSTLSITPITTSGSSSITAPAGSKFVLIEMWGGGGGGGRGVFDFGNDEPLGGGGGGGGAYIKKLVELPSLYTFNYTVGTGGAGGTSGAPPNNGGDTTVSWLANTLTAGGGLAAQNAVDGGLGGAGGTPTNGDAGSASGKSGGDGGLTNTSSGGTGGYCPYGGLGGTPRVGTNTGNPGVAPGGGGGANISNSVGVTANGGAGAVGAIKFTFFTDGAFIAEHENNNSIPNTGTVRLGDFRSTSTYTVDRDFETDNYTGQFRAYQSPDFSYSYYRTGLCTSDAVATIFGGLASDQTPVGTKGTIDVIGRSINALGETAVVNSIFDWRLVAYAGDEGSPAAAALFLEGDRRESVWDFPWTTASVTLNNATITLNRIDTVVPAGSYDSVRNLTSWVWNNQIFGFVNGDPTPFTFKARVTIV